MNRKRVCAYIVRSGEDRNGQYRHEIEIQRYDEEDARTSRFYRRTPRRVGRLNRASIIWNELDD